MVVEGNELSWPSPPPSQVSGVSYLVCVVCMQFKRTLYKHCYHLHESRVIGARTLDLWRCTATSFSKYGQHKNNFTCMYSFPYHTLSCWPNTPRSSQGFILVNIPRHIHPRSAWGFILVNIPCHIHPRLQGHPEGLYWSRVDWGVVMDVNFSLMLNLLPSNNVRKWNKMETMLNISSIFYYYCIKIYIFNETWYLKYSYIWLFNVHQ